MRKNILLTGAPGCGKSTLIVGLVERLKINARGFTTAEIRSIRGRREGFKIATLAGTEGILAHRDFDRGPRVGLYRVNLADIDRIGAAEIEAAIEDARARLIIIDEIARMELFSRRMQDAITRALDSPKPLLGTIQMKRSDAFLDAVRERPDVELIEMVRGGSADAERQLLEALGGLPGS